MWGRAEPGTATRRPRYAQHLDVLEQVLHVCHCEAVEEGVGLVHLHCQVVILCTDVLGQQVDGLGSPISDSDLGATEGNGVAGSGLEFRWDS